VIVYGLPFGVMFYRSRFSIVALVLVSGMEMIVKIYILLP
jgi:hypothetical protein